MNHFLLKSKVKHTSVLKLKYSIVHVFHKIENYILYIEL